jgi:2-octaprenyl-6-methoxyphenol hydroxylase
MTQTAAPNSEAPTPREVDVLIAGGGMVGASLAAMLASLDLRVMLVEAFPVGSAGQPSFDERHTALSNGSRRALEVLDVWPLVAREATPIQKIHVSDRGRFGFARIDARELGLTALGYNVPNRRLGEALWRKLERSRVEVLAPARVASATLVDGYQRVECLPLETGDASSDTPPTVVRARLVVVADGARSPLRQAAGIGLSDWDYGQTAVVTTVLTQRLHQGVAYERFTPTGPLAVLPISEGRVSVIWSLAPAAAQRALALPDAEFLAELQDAFGFRLGRLLRVGSRQAYPLSLTRADKRVAPRMVVIGNAAQGLHPVAGQGFNLGLRDAASLAEVIADEVRQGANALDVGDGLILHRYAAWRGEDGQRIVRFTDGLVRLFAQPFGPVQLVRDLGLLAFDLLPPAKLAMSRLSLGAAGRVPRLTRGAAL